MSELARIETIVFLQTVDLFSFCSAEEILRIANIAHERSAVAGERIYDLNDRSDHLFCVVRGTVELETRDGRRQVVGPLSTFGVYEILSGRLRTARAQAKEASLLLALDAEDFFDLLAHNIEIVRALFRHLTRKLDALEVVA